MKSKALYWRVKNFDGNYVFERVGNANVQNGSITSIDLLDILDNRNDVVQELLKVIHELQS